MRYQRGQFWMCRSRLQGEALCVALTALTNPTPVPDFVRRAPGHARIHRLDRRSPISACRRALPPAGLAPWSGSRRPPCRILHRGGARPSLPTAKSQTVNEAILLDATAEAML
jgi:hypothetical protein